MQRPWGTICWMYSENREDECARNDMNKEVTGRGRVCRGREGRIVVGIPGLWSLDSI